MGGLEPYAQGLARVLSEQGYTVSGATQHICFIAHLSRWMLQEHMDVGDLLIVSGHADLLERFAVRP